MGVDLDLIVPKAITYIKADAFFTNEQIPVEYINLPDQLYDIPDLEAVGVAMSSGGSLEDAEVGQYASSGPIPTQFMAEMLVVVKATGEEGIQTLYNRLFPIGQAALAAIFGNNLNPDTSDEACAVWAFTPIRFETVPFPGQRGDRGPALMVWSFPVQRIVLDL